VKISLGFQQLNFLFILFQVFISVLIFFVKREKSLVGRVVIQPRDPTLNELYQPTIGPQISVPLSRSLYSQPEPTDLQITQDLYTKLPSISHPILILK
jgi:hypothetical protein